MAQWLPFSVLAAVLTAVLLVLARQSQGLIEEAAKSANEGHDRPDSEAVRSVQTDSAEMDATAVETGIKQVPEGRDTEFEPAATPTPSGDTASHRPKQQAEIKLTPGMLLANVTVTQGVVAILILAAGWYFDIPAAAFGVTSDAISTGVPAIVGGTVFGIGLWAANELSTTVADAVGAAYNENVREMLAPETPGGWTVLFGLVLPIIAIAEELLFRAALIGVPAAGFDLSPWLLAVVASLAFAFGHGAQGRVGVIVTGLLGFVLAAGYILSGSLLLVVVAHYLINALEFFVHEFLDSAAVIPGLEARNRE